jgi:hypothetical protein
MCIFRRVAQREDRAMRRCALLLLAVMWAASAPAQTNVVSAPPPNFVIPNDNGVPAGPFGGLESIAYVARASDPSAAWFNPAGLSVEEQAQISGSAGIYQLTHVRPEGLSDAGGSLEQVPNSVGFTVRATDRWTMGLAIVTTAAWTQQTSAQIVDTIALGNQRFALANESEYSQRIIAVSGGYRMSDSLRLGAGLAIQFTDLDLLQGASDRVADASTLRTLLVVSRFAGSAVQLRPVMGVQYSHEGLRAGMTVRTPGLVFMRGGAASLDGALDTGDAALGASLFDPDAKFEAPLPWEFHGGIGYVVDRAQIEVDLQGFTPIARYSMLSTAEPLVFYADAGPAAPPVVTRQPFPPLLSSRRGIVNVAVGGDYAIRADGTLRIHGGIASDQSPVETGDAVFGSIDLLSWTIGLSGQYGRLRFSVGMNQRSGTADNVVLQNLIGARTISTPFDVRTTGFIYALAFQF